MRPRRPVPVHNLKVTRKGKVKKRSFLWRMRRALYLGALSMMLLAAGLAYVLTSIDLPVDPRVAQTQKQTSFICAADVAVDCNASNAMARLHGSEDRVLVTWDQIPPILREAVVSAEDRDFFRHSGVDPAGIARAAYHDIKGTSVSRQGGSTITQQYVKQEYLSAEQTFTRKIKEAVMAVKLEQKISKEEILTRYLNTVYFGRGAYGVQAASRTWFGHDVQQIDAGEAAFLAGLLRNPNGADPYRGEDALAEAVRRRRVTLGAMEEEGYVTAEERAAFEAVSMDPAPAGEDDSDRMIKRPPVPSTLGEEVKGEEHGSRYFAEEVRKWLINRYNEDIVFGGGLKVYTTLDLDLQRHAFETVTETLDETGDPDAAIISIDSSGHIVAMMGGRNYERSQVNLATGSGGSGRGAGSTFKTFALVDAVRRGYSLNSLVASPPKAEITDPRCLSEDGDAWTVSGGPGGSRNLIDITKNSINTAYADMAVELGPDSVARTAVDMGVAGLEDEDPLCSWVLGTAEVTPLEMATGYSTLMNRGVRKDPILVTKVEFPDGRVDTFVPEEERVLTPDQAALVTHALEEVITGGTGTLAAIGRPAAGKTGTTQQNADAWFVGYTPELTTAVWMGYRDQLRPMDDVHGLKAQGGNFPAQMFGRYMGLATAGFAATHFPEVTSSMRQQGQPLFPALGRNGYVGAGYTQGDNGGMATGGGSSTTTAPSTPSTQTTAAAPQSTAPSTTAPVTTVPQTSVPIGTEEDDSAVDGT